jgi:hypothetical protein
MTKALLGVAFAGLALCALPLRAADVPSSSAAFLQASPASSCAVESSTAPSLPELLPLPALQAAGFCGCGDPACFSLLVNSLCSTPAGVVGTCVQSRVCPSGATYTCACM